MTNRPYFVLAVRNDGLEPRRDDADWTPQFGDYDLETVKFERDDYRDHGARAVDLKIVRLPNAQQSTLNAAIDALNGRNCDLVETPVRTCRGCDNPPLPGYDVCAACGEEGY